MPLLETMLPKYPATEKPTERNRLQQPVLVGHTRALGFVLVWFVCFVLRTAVPASIACSGEKLPQVQGGRAAAAVLAELWGEEPSTFQAAAVGTKTRFVAARREVTKSGGERASAVQAQWHLLMSRKPGETSEKRVCPCGYLASRDFSISTCKTRDDDSSCLCNRSEVWEDLII